MTTEDDGARSARPVGPSETAEAAIPTTPSWHDPDENIIRLWQVRGRATAEADRILTLAGDDTDSEAQRHADALDEKATEIEKRIAIMIPNGPTGWAVQVALLALWRERGSRADHLDQRLSERLGAYFLGTVSLLLNTPNGGPAKRRADNPDAKLFALEVEMKAAHEGLDADPGGNDEHQKWLDRMDAAEKAALAIQAKTPSDVAAKLRIFAYYQDPPRDDDAVFNDCIRNVIEDARRLDAPNGGVVEKNVYLNPELSEATDLLHRITAVGFDDDERLTALIAEMYVLAPTAVAKPAQNLSEILVKMRLALWHEGDVEKYAYDLAYLRSAISDMERLGGFGIGTTVPADLDAELQSLWRAYLRNRAEWNKTEEDTPEYERCHEESTAIATRISATPAQGIVGLAVKIMIAANEPYEHEAVADQTTLDDKALISARDDAMRLTGIGGAS